MAPPPVTPSPHRFLIARPEHKVTRQQHLPQASARHFNATPRFTSTNSRRDVSVAPAAAVPAPPKALHTLSTCKVVARDAIEDSLSEQDELYESVEDGTTQERCRSRSSSHSDILQDYIDVPAKRRRLSSPGSREESTTERTNDFMSDHEDYARTDRPRRKHSRSVSSEFLVHQPVIHKLHTGAHTPRFRVPATPRQAVVSDTKDDYHELKEAFSKPPRFEASGENDFQNTSFEPLPTAFSPHRRGQKYVPDGLAAEVVGWLFNVGSTPNSVSSVGKNEGPWIFEIVIDELSGDAASGFTMVRGLLVSGDIRTGTRNDIGAMKLVLAGDGISEDLRRSVPLGIGKRVGIRAPAWDISIDGESWRIAVSWKVLFGNT